MMTESEFDELAEATLQDIEAQVENADSDLDFDMAAGILTLTAPNGSRIIINRQPATREIWVAAKSGGYHCGRRDDAWFCASTGETLQQLLSRVIAEQGGGDIVFG
ncbi:iron donor protein CyaY [Perlucidibaca piscinae]|uniref:iron donor protein CyaY n=1 Tax=Perlucidibaca piscinae TaxID=392589 RepID=UPI0003B57C70|nr:iron donor protein CyaY [Perlucidibaca piscinae]